jgi:Family of unknown function (DUF6428)
MKLSEIKKHLSTAKAVNFELENGAKVPQHFHVTEVGIVTKHFIDCGGTERTEKVANFQLWNANDFEHRLKPTKLLNIISLSEQKLGMEDLEIEVEYQTETISKYGVEFVNNAFVLTNLNTACLAMDKCGIPTLETKTEKEQSCCKPGGGCC